ncbi:hypothetical protein V5O48_005206 [Marasmius crinis-equi]|uniref:Uncharacterized protein n=1 Tax=Marasmius crinis-equi TaxID=585013 RepID=A0ABR3FN08_9AGAR
MSYLCEPSSSKHHLHFHSRRHNTDDEHDLSRLLDPAYARARPSSPQTKVYKDHHGDFHDPDYRHFPSSSSSSSGNTRSKRVNSGSSLTRPSWELGMGSGMDEEEFEALYNDGAEDEKRESSRRHSGHHRNTYTPYASYYPTSTYSSSSSSSYASPSSSPSSSPSTLATSLSDSELPSYSSPSSYHHNKLTKRLLSRNTRSSFEEHVHPYEVDTEDIEDSISLHEEEETKASAEPGVSCSEAMKKQWHAVQLSVRFGVFRAQRRVKEALGTKR